MLYRESGELKLAEEKVLFTRSGVEHEQAVVEGRDWWLSFEEQWDDMVIIGFEDITYTPEQVERFEEVKNLDINESILNDYVIDGVVGEGLKMLEFEKENGRLKQLLADLTEIVLMRGDL